MNRPWQPRLQAQVRRSHSTAAGKLSGHYSGQRSVAMAPNSQSPAPVRSRSWGISPALMGVASLALLVASPGLFWEKEYIYKLERNTTRLPQQDDIVESDYVRNTVHFRSQGELLEGWFYEPLPQNPATPPPVVIMCHGLGAQKDMGLHGYAEQFAQAGMAVLVFDYRGFGGSDGVIRHWVSWKRHTQDLQAALDWVYEGGLGKGRVDTSRIALWGVSYSGGHTIMTAAKEENRAKIKALVANEPYLSGEGNIKKALNDRGPSVIARLLFAAVLDKGREVLGLPPIYLKLVGSDHELAVLAMSDEELKLSRGGSPTPPIRIGGWQNLCSARMLIDNLVYRPLSHVHKIRCPVMFVCGSKDVITLPENIHKAARILGDRATVLERPYGHIEMHRKMVQPEELAPVIDFLRHNLGIRPDHKETHPHETQATLDQEAPEVL